MSEPLVATGLVRASVVLAAMAAACPALACHPVASAVVFCAAETAEWARAPRQGSGETDFSWYGPSYTVVFNPGLIASLATHASPKSAMEVLVSEIVRGEGTRLTGVVVQDRVQPGADVVLRSVLQFQADHGPYSVAALLGEFGAPPVRVCWMIVDDQGGPLVALLTVTEAAIMALRADSDASNG